MQLLIVSVQCVLGTGSTVEIPEWVVGTSLKTLRSISPPSIKVCFLGRACQSGIKNSVITLGNDEECVRAPVSVARELYFKAEL